MKKRRLWLPAGALLMMISLLISCTPAPTETTEGQTVTGEVVQKEAGEPAKTAGETQGEREKGEEEAVSAGPRYGGWLTTASETSSIGGWDPVYGETYWALHPVSLALMRGNYYNGPAGTDDVTWIYAVQEEPQFMTRGLAQSWEIVDARTMVVHLHEGIHWHDKAPVNGREVTAEDIAWSFNRMLEIPRSGIPPIAYMLDGITYSATDRYTFKVEFGKPDVRSLITTLDWYRHTAREVIETYGSQDDWKHVVGNGPFMVTDYVPASSITYTKNPVYWETDPEGRSVPFIDGFTALIIPDSSTRMAALRAGKIDVLTSVYWYDAEDLLRTATNLQTAGGRVSNQRVVGMMCDQPPFDDVRVRRAMAIAIDHQAIAEDYHKGRAGVYPSVMLPPGSPMYAPLEERPESTQELFVYDPDKAKQLLADAGYPNGFKTLINVTTTGDSADLAALVKDYWSMVGVEAEIKVWEPATYTSLLYGMKLEGARIGGSILSWGNWSWVYQPGSRWCFEKFTDPVLTKMIEDATTQWVDRDKWIQDWRNINIYVVDQVYEHCIPGPYYHNLWQPWLMNYHGEYSLGRTDYRGFAAYVWLDLDTKREMVGHE